MISQRRSTTSQVDFLWIKTGSFHLFLRTSVITMKPKNPASQNILPQILRLILSLPMDNLSSNLLLRAKWDFSLPARGAVEHSETEGLPIQDNLIARNFLDLITNLSRFFKFPCLDRFIKLDFEILENNFFFSLSSSLEFLYFTSCKRSKILI